MLVGFASMQEALIIGTMSMVKWLQDLIIMGYFHDCQTSELNNFTSQHKYVKLNKKHENYKTG